MLSFAALQLILNWRVRWRV